MTKPFFLAFIIFFFPPYSQAEGSIQTLQKIKAVVTLEAIRAAGQLFPFDQFISFAETYILRNLEDNKIYFGISYEAYEIYKNAVNLLALNTPKSAHSFEHTLLLKVQDVVTHLIYTCEVRNFGSIRIKENFKHTYLLVLFEHWNNP